MYLNTLWCYVCEGGVLGAGKMMGTYVVADSRQFPKLPGLAQQTGREGMRCEGCVGDYTPTM